MTEPPSDEVQVETRRRRPGRMRRWVLRPVAWLVAIVLALAAILLWVLHLPRFQRSVLDRYTPQLEELLGRVVEVGDIEVRLLPLTLELHDVRLAGPRVEDPDVATIRRLYADIDLPSLWRRHLQLDRVEIEGLEFFIERLEEETNLPRVDRGDRKTADSNSERRFQVALGTLEVSDSHFRYEQLDLPLGVTAHGIEASLLGGRGLAASGALAIDQVALRLAEGGLTGSIDGRVTVDQAGVRLDATRLQTDESSLAVQGSVVWLGDRRVNLEFQGTTSTDLARQLGYLDDQVEGSAAVEGGFEWRPEAWGFRAELTSEEIELLDQWRLTDARLQVAGDPNGVWVDLLEASILGGRSTGRYELDLQSGNRPSALDLTLTGIELPKFLGAMDWSVPGLGGGVDAEMSYRFLESDWEQGTGWGTLQARPSTRGRNATLQFRGSIPFTIEAGLLKSEAARFRAPDQQILATTWYDLGRRTGQIEATLQSEDLGPVGALLPIGATETTEPVLWLPTVGRGRIAAQIDLEPSGVELAVDLDLADVAAPGLQADRLLGHLELRDERLENLRLEFSRPAAAGLLTGQIPLSTQEGLELGLEIAGWPVTEFAPWIPAELPLEGLFYGDVDLAGTESAIVGSVSGRLEGAATTGLSLGTLWADLRWDGERLEVDRALVPVGDGQLEAAGSLVFEGGSLDLTLDAESLDLRELPLAPGVPALGGFLDGAGRLGGSTAVPVLDLDLQVAELMIAETALGNAAATASWAEGTLEVEAEAERWLALAGGGRLDLGGSDLSFDLRIMDLARLGSLVAPEGPELSGSLQAEIQAGGKGPFAVEQATIEVPAAVLGVDGHTLSLLEPARFEWSPERLAVRSLYVEEPGRPGEAFVHGTIELAESRLDLRVQASLAADWLELFVEGLDIGGEIDVLGAVRGSFAEPVVRAQAGVVNGRLRSEEITQPVQQINGVVLLDPDSIVIDGLDGRLGSGGIRVGGRLLWPTEELALGGRVQVALTAATLNYPDGMELRGSGELVWSGEASGQTIRGLVELDRARYLQDLDIDLMSLVEGFFRRRPETVATTDETLEGIALNVAVRAPAAVRIDNNVADVRASADLNLRGTLARPVVFGELTSEPESTLLYSGNEYTLERAVVTFANPYRMEPLFDIEATTRIAAYDVAVSLFGSLERFEVTLSSDPPLPDAEVFGLLLGGRPIDPNAPRAEDSKITAESLLYGQATSALGRRVGELFGVDSLRVEPLSTSGRSLSSARVTVGKRLSSRWYATYSYDPSSTANQRLQLEWQATDSLLVRLTQDDESYAVDLLWENSF